MLKKQRPTDVDKYVGMRLKDRRTMLGLSQKKLGGMITPNVTFQQVQKYESGVNRLTSGRLYEISEYLLVPISYFFDGYDKNREPIDTQIRKDTNSLIKYFSKITDSTLKKSVINLARSLSMSEIQEDYTKRTKEYMLSNCKKLGDSDE